MKIYTLTCHDVYNYGASLQAFALMKFLEENGHDVRILDYKPDYLNAKFRFSRYIDEKSPYFTKCERNIFYKYVYITLRYFKDISKYKLKKAFDAFHKKYYRLSVQYNSYLDLVKHCPDADAYIVGSDQVWNNNPLNNGWDPAFFLQFGAMSTKRISYAASFGSSTQYPDIIKIWLKSLNGISIRESHSKVFFDNNELNAEEVCDPVFLLSKEQWARYINLESNENQYILIYDLSGRNEKMLQDAKILAKKYNCKIINIALKSKKRGIENIQDIGPDKFLNLIFNATIILSDSFHATSFSLIFQKEFFTYEFKNTQSSQRMINILDKIGLKSRYKTTDISVECNNIIDYNKISLRLKEYSGQSKEWLLSHLM